jgi:hypothetical protein
MNISQRVTVAFLLATMVAIATWLVIVFGVSV